MRLPRLVDLRRQTLRTCLPHQDAEAGSSCCRFLQIFSVEAGSYLLSGNHCGDSRKSAALLTRAVYGNYIVIGLGRSILLLVVDK
jgi:hypothetical protein